MRDGVLFVCTWTWAEASNTGRRDPGGHGRQSGSDRNFSKLCEERGIKLEANTDRRQEWQDVAIRETAERKYCCYCSRMARVVGLVYHLFLVHLFTQSN